jgi:hypothetical protein
MLLVANLQVVPQPVNPGLRQAAAMTDTAFSGTLMIVSLRGIDLGWLELTIELLKSMTAVEKATEVRDSARSLKTALRVPGTASFTSSPWTVPQYEAVSSFEAENTARYCEALTSESDRSAPRIQRSLQEFGMWATVKALADDRLCEDGPETIRLAALKGIESLYPPGTTFCLVGTEFEAINDIPTREGWHRPYRQARATVRNRAVLPTYEGLSARLIDAPPLQEKDERAQRTAKAVSSLMPLIALNPQDHVSIARCEVDAEYESV